MSRRNKRGKDDEAGAEKKKPDPSATALALRKRRNKRLMILGVIVLLVPVLELFAYRYRAITIVIANHCPFPVTGVKFSYPGGDFTADEIRPDDSVTRVIRPEFTFSRADFSSYRTTIDFRTPDARHRELRKFTTVDYSCQETYAIEPGPDSGRVEIKQRTTPGFPLSAIRDLMARLGIG